MEEAEKRARRGLRKKHAVDSAKPQNKPLKILTASGVFHVTSLTPPKYVHGFLETDRPQTPRHFKVEDMPTTVKRAKRRIIDFDEPSNVLPKPRWTDNDAQQSKRRRHGTDMHVYNIGPTQFILKQTEPTGTRRKQPSSTLIPKELVEFRKRNLYRKGIPRQDPRTLLREKQKVAQNQQL